MPSRRTSPSCSSSSLPTHADRSILPLAIASSSVSLLAGETRREDARWPSFFLPRRPHRISTTFGDSPAKHDGKMRDGRLFSYRDGHTEFPPRSGTLPALFARTRIGHTFSCHY